ncbi:hypothetical protein ACTNEO_05130 [Gracilibacillus sp. HCP3S3_G5_1]|uniref:hypothetical protein n=1 Tax=unclassified Gracilibacillus TaxID=2625209 RepID=UPI003F8A453E
MKLGKNYYMYLKRARKNGIPTAEFYARVKYRGWKMEDAAKLPPGSRKPKYDEEGK